MIRILLAAALFAPASGVLAQTAGSNSQAQMQAGYGNARYSVTRPQSGSTRDPQGNRLIVDGIIQSGASAYSRQSGGAASSYAGAGAGGGVAGSTAIGNSLNVVVQGSHNTVIVNSTQINNGDVSAGTDLNGTLRLP